MTLRFLLDTSIVSAPVAKTPDPRVMERIRKHGLESAIAAPVLHELMFGCSRLPKSRRRNRQLLLVAIIVIVGFFFKKCFISKIMFRRIKRMPFL